jgi:dipeptidyl aminopeptidase/acylaminoacyl peptidase
MRKAYPLLMTVLLVACGTVSAPAAAPTQTAFPTFTNTVSPPPPTQTLEPFEQYTIAYLRQRTYGGGRLEVLEKTEEKDAFTGYSIRYPSDGLAIYGFMNIPHGSGPFPVLVSIHGYAPPGTYNVFDSGSDSADYFAENGFIVLHPGLRNQPPSDSGDNLLRVGMSLDVLNLIALLKSQDSLPPELSVANVETLGLYGVSLGGEIALRVLTVSPDVTAAVLYSPLSGNDERNSRQMTAIVGDEQFQLDAQIPLELLDRISPMYFYQHIRSAVQIHHGTADTTAPISWAVETCSFLESAYVPVQCIYYPDAEHIFGGQDKENLRQSALDFYRLHLIP